MARYVWLVCLLVGCGGGGAEAPPARPPAPAVGAPLEGLPGARSFKSGPIQITADGRFVWTANTDHDTVSRLDTRDLSVREFALPADARHAPRSLSVTGDGDEVWVACHDSDRVYVLDGATGAVRARIDLPWGCGPCGVALSPDGARALVTLLRRAAIAELDTATRAVRGLVEPVWRTPLGVAWEENGETAWVTHLLVEGGEHPKVSRVDCSGPDAQLAGDVRAGATDPRQSSKLAAPFDVAEGGYLTFRGHLAQQPGVPEMWLPTQYNNIHEDRFSPDSTVQASIRRLRTDTLSLQNDVATKVVLTAVHAHETTGNNAYVGPGWDARVAGPIDIAFSADGTLAYLVCENSNDVVVLPTDATTVRPAGAPSLVEIAVGDRPVGIAVSPVDGGAYVLNRLSRDVSVLSLGRAEETRRVRVAADEPFDDAFLRGAKLFHASDDPRISSNGKVACASCHVDGETDGRTWSFHRLAGRSGPRATPSLLGLGLAFGPRDAATGFGQLHRSGDRDEVQDFDATFRSALMGGAGFLASPQPALGAPNAGRDADLDALAHYLLTLPPLARSPFRAPDGALSEAAVRGAALFLAAGCAACHVPETGFQDGRFHDVGQRRAEGEEELNQGARAPFQWHVATPSLVGLFATPGYEGVAGFADDVDGFLADIAGRTSHGDIGGLSGQQRADLAAFLLSIDGDLTAAEVRNARDTTAPRVARVAVSSLTRIDVWFSEPVTRASAEDLTHWSVNGGAVPVTAAAWDARNGDRVALTVALAKNASYTVAATGVVDDAGNAVGASDRATATVGDTLTITFGASGNENYTIPVHDAGMVGSGLATWSHDAAWLFRDNKGFVRFDWQDAARAAGLADAADLVAASFSLRAEFGHRHPIEVRRCLQAWSDSPNGGDWNRNANGAPTWRDHAHPNGRWNQAGAKRTAPGVEGRAAADYDGAHDTARTPDAVANVGSTTEPIVFDGPGVTDAFRFWFEHEDVDYGYVLAFAPGPAEGVSLKLWRHEHGRGDKGPVLTLTFRLP